MSDFEPFWNTLQLLVWVYLGDRKLIARCAEDYSEDHWYWSTPVVLNDSGGRERQLVKTSADKLSVLWVTIKGIELEAANKGPYASIEDAQCDIHEKLLTAGIVASGIRAATGEREDIGSAAWLDLSVDFDNSIAAHKRRGHAVFTHLRFKSEHTQSIWPLVKSASEGGADPEVHKGKGGRSPGSGEFDELGILIEVLRHLAAGKAPSAFAAAGQLAHKAPGTATKDSKQRRIASKFRKWVGFSRLPAGKTWADVERELNSNSNSE